MKCKDCNSCKKGFWASKPEAYICIGVQEPFEITDINHECTEYPDKNCEKLRECYQILAKAKELKIKYCQRKCLSVPEFDCIDDYMIPIERKPVKVLAEVVLCKDCEHYKRVKGSVGEWRDCELSHDDMDPDDFCSRGVLRDEEESL